IVGRKAFVVAGDKIIGRQLDCDVGLVRAIVGLHLLLTDGLKALQLLIHDLAVKLFVPLFDLFLVIHFTRIEVVVGYRLYRSLYAGSKFTAGIGQRFLLRCRKVHAFSQRVGSEELVVGEVVAARARNINLGLTFG